MFEGHVVQPGIRYGWNFGLAFAVSERTTFGAAIAGGLQKDLKVDGATVGGSASEPISARASIVHRMPNDQKR